MNEHPWWGEWRRQAIVAISEGFCPEELGHGPLRLDTGGCTFTSWHGPTVTRFPSGGFCPRCQVWWLTEQHDDDDDIYVTAHYALPDPLLAPYKISTKSAPT